MQKFYGRFWLIVLITGLLMAALYSFASGRISPLPESENAMLDIGFMIGIEVVLAICAIIGTSSFSSKSYYLKGTILKAFFSGTATLIFGTVALIVYARTTHALFPQFMWQVVWILSAVMSLLVLPNLARKQ